MIICLCEGVSDRDVQSAVGRGCRSVADLSRSNGAGSGCGSCHSQLRELIAHHRPDTGAVAPNAPLVPAAPLV